MVSEPLHTADIGRSACCPQVPKSISTASRCELINTQLEIEGKLPDDLKGHMFLVTPVGSVNSGGLPYPNGDSVLSGDGMVYRLDFDCPDQVRLTTRIAKPPDYYADKATRPGSKYDKYRFRNHGITRFSLSLGARNQLNTAFLPMKFDRDANERLLVTYDAGRPYEIDTQTLEVITPVGRNSEWRTEIEGVDFPFPPILSTAHPCFDAHEQKMFTVNYGRSLNNFLETLPWAYNLETLPKGVNALFAAIAQFLPQIDLFKFILDSYTKEFQNLLQLYMNLLTKLTGLDVKNFVYLICWDGVGNLERWKLVLPDRSPVKIEQSMHQIGISKDYVVLLDTAFTTGLEQLINNPFPENKTIEQLLRQVSERPASPDSVFYIVRRADLKMGQYPACSQQEVEVVVRPVTIPLPAAHFLVDYDNPDGNITIHVAHICGMDVAEWVRQYDKSAYPPFNPVESYLAGLENDEIDIGRLGRYVVNGETGAIAESKVISDFQCTWGLELYTYPERSPETNLPLDRLENIYWCSYGLWKQLMTQATVELNQSFKYQQLPVSQVLNLAEKGVPAYLFRLHTKSMVIADAYEFPPGHMTLSPQFIPSSRAKHTTDGYIICTVWYNDKNEFWIFDANDLTKNGQAPLCKLRHTSLNFALTLHTAWLPEIGECQADYTIGVRQDYEELVKQKSLEIQELFYQEIYPHFENV